MRRSRACSSTPRSTTGTPARTTGRINASNPCSEYMHLDDSACNLASLNLMKFVERRPATSTSTAFRHAVDVADHGAGHRRRATRAIRRRRSTKNAHAFRELGLGYANLGALLMSLGLPVRLGRRAAVRGRGDRAHVRRGLPPVGAHRRRAGTVRGLRAEPRADAARDRQAPRRRAQDRPGAACRSTSSARRARAWDEALATAASARLPQLAGDGARADRHDRVHDGLRHDRRRARHRARQVQEARRRRHAEDRQQHGAAGAAGASATRAREVQEIVEYIDEQETIEGAPHLRDEHLAVFDCAFKPQRGARARSTTSATSA